MHVSHRFRDSAAECLLASQDACQPYYRNLFLSMAASWLSLALVCELEHGRSIKSNGLLVA